MYFMSIVFSYENVMNNLFNREMTGTMQLLTMSYNSGANFVAAMLEQCVRATLETSNQFHRVFHGLTFHHTIHHLLCLSKRLKLSAWRVQHKPLLVFLASIGVLTSLYIRNCVQGAAQIASPCNIALIIKQFCRTKRNVAATENLHKATPKGFLQSEFSEVNSKNTSVSTVLSVFLRTFCYSCM